MKKRILIVSAVLTLTVAGLAWATVAYQWTIPYSSVKLWGSGTTDVTIDPSGTSGTHGNKAFLYTDYYGAGTPCRAGMATDTINVPRASVMVLRENGSSNNVASAWMESSGGAWVKTWSDGKATVTSGSGAQVEASTNGDVVITLGQ